MLRETDPQTTMWELLLPEEAKRLPAELVRIDAYLDDERFIAPWRALFDRRLGRPSVPIDTLLRLLYLKHRYGLGYESLCREVSDSISWRRFCRIGRTGRCRTRPRWSSWSAGPAPRSSSSSIRRWWPSSPPASCCGPASCGWIPRWWRPTSTTRPTRICWSRRSASSVGWSGGSRPEGRPAGPGSAIVAARLGGGSSSWLGPCGGGAGWRWARWTGSPARSQRSLGAPCARCRWWRATPAGQVPAGLMMGGLVGWSASWRRRSRRPSGCWPRPTSAWPATG